MFCTGCGTPIQPHDHFCHHCGKQMHPVDLGQPPHRRKTAPWVIVLGVVFLLASFWFTWSTLSYSNLESPVRAQLASIRQGKIPEAYYEYTSKKFQAATSLDQFKLFVNSHSVLRDNSSATFESPIIDDSHGMLRGILFSTGGDKAPVQYLLERQEEEWKILNMQLSAVSDASHPVNGTKVTTSQEDALFLPITEQLVDLKEGRDREAYDDVSSGFKNATSYDQFQAFVKRFPVLKSHTGHAFKERAIQGDRAAVRVDLLSGKEVTPVEYHLVKDGNSWKVWSLQVLLPQKDQAPELTHMLVPIQDQLKALKKKDLKKAYDDYVSEEFKKITSFTAFEAFVDRFKIFTDYTKVEYKQPRMEETGGKVLVVLYKKDGSSSTVEYTMGIENGEWKVWGFRLTTHKADQQQSFRKAEDSTFSAQVLARIASQQLQQIKQGNLDAAYQEYTSKEFRKATSLDVFKQFLGKYPVFGNFRSVEFGNLMLNNNIATLRGMFVNAEGESVPVEFDFILNDANEWKVLRIQVLTDDDAHSLTDPSKQYLPYFPKIVIGTEVDAQGAVIDETTTILDTKKKIYANVYVNGKKGETVTVIFKHIDSNSKIPAVTSSPLPQNGVFRTSFSFNPPPQGWPKGNYALEIESSTGQEETYNFAIN